MHVLYNCAVYVYRSGGPDRLPHREGAVTYLGMWSLDQIRQTRTPWMAHLERYGPNRIIVL